MKACPLCAQDIEDAAILCAHCNPEAAVPTTAAGLRRAWRPALMVATVSVLAVLALSGTTLLRARATQPSPKAPAVAMTLADRVEHLPPDSWKAVPLSLPHDGVLEVEVGVESGNPVNVFVTTPADMQRMLGDDLTTVSQHPGFGATLTKRFIREGQLTAGNYYLVVHDPSARRTPGAVSDVSIQANLRQ